MSITGGRLAAGAVCARARRETDKANNTSDFMELIIPGLSGPSASWTYLSTSSPSGTIMRPWRCPPKQSKQEHSNEEESIPCTNCLGVESDADARLWFCPRADQYASERLLRRSDS